MPYSARFIFRATLLSAVISAFLLSGTLQAMEIQKFDKMAGPDQDEYISAVC